MTRRACVGRAIDIPRTPLPAPVCGGAVLLAITSAGGMAVLCACHATNTALRCLRCCLRCVSAVHTDSWHLITAWSEG